MAFDRRWFFQVTAELRRMPIDNTGQDLTTQMVRFCLFNTVVFSWLFFLHFGRMLFSFFFFFAKFVAGLAP